MVTGMPTAAKTSDRKVLETVRFARKAKMAEGLNDV